jgi:fumarate reductase flavoprotein subunit
MHERALDNLKLKEITMGNIEKSNINNSQADIVVLGGGGSGLCAAVKAAESGLKNIMLIEARNAIGGNAARAGGVWAVESPAQKRAGEKYTIDQAYIEKMFSTNWKLDPRLIRSLINVSGEVIQWLENKGLIFDVFGMGLDDREGAYPKTTHVARPLPSGKVMGAAMIEVVQKEAQNLGVKIITGITGKKLITDKTGKITGILADQKGQKIIINTNAVIIASGGFSGNKELMNRFFPSKQGTSNFFTSLPYKGEGIIMAEEAGAVVDDCVSHLSFGPHHYPYAASLNSFLRRPDLINVNKIGERFVDESYYLGHQHHYGSALDRQPDQICYGLIDDAKLRDIANKKDTCGGKAFGVGIGIEKFFETVFDDFKTDDAKKQAKIAEDWDEMARFIGCKPEVLKSTIEQYNSFCEKGYDYDFLKPKEYLFPLRTPPFYAIIGRQGSDVTFGGIKVNARLEVINKQYEVIKGLYAAGNICGSMYTNPYAVKFAGSSMGFAYYSGYIAGMEAAKYISGN